MSVEFPHAAGRLADFVRESNRIENITRRPFKAEIEAHIRLIELPTVRLIDVVDFVKITAPGHELRDREGLDVRVGRHIAPRGGESVRIQLGHLLADIAQRGFSAHPSPFDAHRTYELLHPFTDGNGRSGRALWLWMCLRDPAWPYALAWGFLRTYYYQSLDAARP